jgi:hypothetical protein
LLFNFHYFSCCCSVLISVIICVAVLITDHQLWIIWLISNTFSWSSICSLTLLET